MFKIVLRPRAKLDIKGIWRYTSKEWGDEQANSYTLKIGVVINSLAENPYKGAAIDYIRKGYRKQLVGKHLIIYRVTSEVIDIVRVLRQDMDIQRHLVSR